MSDRQAKGQGAGMGVGAVKVVEGKHSNCFQTKKDPGGCTYPAFNSPDTWMSAGVSPLDSHVRLVQRHHRSTGSIRSLFVTP